MTTDALPERRTIIQIVGNDGAIFLGRLHRFDHDVRRGLSERGVDSTGVEPTGAEFPKNMIPVDIAGLELRSGGIPAVRHAHRAADSKAALRKVKSVTHTAADAVVFTPLDEVGGNPTLHDKILHEVTDLIIDERRDDAGLVAETFAEAARSIVFAAAFPGTKRARGADATFTGIEAKHHLAERDLIELAVSLRT